MARRRSTPPAGTDETTDSGIEEAEAEEAQLDDEAEEYVEDSGDTDGGAVPEEEIDDDDDIPAPPKISLLTRVSTWRPPPRQLPVDNRGKLLSERQIVEGLDRRERIAAGVAGVLALAFATLFAIAYSTQHIKKVKGASVSASTAETIIAVLAVPAIIMLVGVWVKRRALVGFCAFIVGYALLALGGGIYGFAYFLLAGWLLYRSYKLSKQRREAGLDPRGRPLPARAGRPSRTGTGTRGSTATRSGKNAAATVTERKPPPKSKRYTPPKGTLPGRTTRTTRPTKGR